MKVWFTEGVSDNIRICRRCGGCPAENTYFARACLKMSCKFPKRDMDVCIYSLDNVGF